MKTNTFTHYLLPSTVFFLLMTGCAIAPVATSFDDARMVHKGEVQSSVSYNSYRADEPVLPSTGQSQTSFINTNNNIGVRIALGDSNFNCGFHYELLVPHEIIPLISNYISFEPKFKIMKNKVAFSVPLGVYLTGAAISGAQISPAFLFSFGDDKYFEFNFSPKTLLLIGSETRIFFCFSAGFGLSTNLNKWSIRPEAGYTISHGGGSGILHTGIALSFNFGK